MQVVSALRSVYSHPYDIDLFIGGVVETPLPNAALGPTFAGLFALEFLNLRRADRFFYTSNIGQPYALTSSNRNLSFFQTRSQDVDLQRYDTCYIQFVKLNVVFPFILFRSIGRNRKSVFG